MTKTNSLVMAVLVAATLAVFSSVAAQAGEQVRVDLTQLDCKWVGRFQKLVIENGLRTTPATETRLTHNQPASLESCDNDEVLKEVRRQVDLGHGSLDAQVFVETKDLSACSSLCSKSIRETVTLIVPLTSNPTGVEQLHFVSSQTGLAYCKPSSTAQCPFLSNYSLDLPVWELRARSTPPT